MNSIEAELANKPLIPLEKLVDGMIKLVEDMDFSQKKHIVQETITKVVATKEEISVWGHLPVLALQEVKSNEENSNSKFGTQHENS